MQKEKIVKTKLAHKYLVLVAVLILTLSVFVLGSSLRTDCTAEYRSDVRVSIDGSVYDAEIVDTDDERARGLSGRSCIGMNQAMLFEYETPVRGGIWMKDMEFSIDIVWLDENKKVVTLKDYASPESYPEIFYPTKPATYIIEFPAGAIATARLQLNDSLSW